MSQILDIKEVASNLEMYVTKRSIGEIKSLITSLPSMNEAGLGGLEWGSIVTIAGMSGAGKTALSGILTRDLPKLNPTEPIVVFDLNFEMPSIKLLAREVSGMLGITIKELLSAEDAFTDFDNFKAALIELQKRENKYLEVGTTAIAIKNKILEIYEAYNPNRDKKNFYKDVGIVVKLDHSILVKKGANEQSQLESLHNLASMFNELKKEIKIITIILSQLNRSIEAPERRDFRNKMNQYPTKADIYGADSLYQFSDIVLIAHAPEKLNLNIYGPDDLPTKGLIYLHYLKIREGEPFIRAARNQFAFNRIEELKPSELLTINDKKEQDDYL